MRNTLFILLGLVAFFSCTEKETVYVNQHEDIVFEDNVAPPYDEVTKVQIQSYVNKLYIDLLGREPSLDELETTATMLKDNQLNESARISVVTDLITQDDYYSRLWEVYRRAYLNGVSAAQIESEVFALEFFYDDISQNTDPTSIALAGLILLELEKLDLLINAEEDYRKGDIMIDEFMHRIAFNGIYDEINMGAENMVLACFENFLKRQPTEAELIAGVTMVDENVSAQLLLQDGRDKNDFVTIITSTPEFYQGLVFDIYQQLLVRSPTSLEMTEATEQLLQNKDYQALQTEVAITDEYAGF
ncbi:MAG: hypothetical protein AB8F74_01925 [Saprospiraceae bacterium]